MDVHYSSKSYEWETPQELFDKLHAIHKFTVDVCASKENAKRALYFSKEDSGLDKNWGMYGTSFWMNPPYGREIGKWMKKAYEESLKGISVVCLVPARTDTAWWHDYAAKGKVEFIRGRLKFNGHKDNAPFPNALVIFNGIDQQQRG